jgi:BirA family transcriptional regulator, biotin operon repressor / biotin---[acetyl-CoA-carboxylase] ligase
MTSDGRLDHARHLHLDTVDSTNAEGLRLAGAGERGPLWITATRQTAGRGRSGRSWSAPEGNLAASFVIAPVCRLDDLHQLALLAGVAVYDAIVQAAEHDIPGLRLKWPNDILIGRGKAGGILVETTVLGQCAVAVIGVGLNIVAAPTLEGRVVARLVDHAKGLTSAVLLNALDRAMARWLDAWDSGAGFASVRSAWLTRAGELGESLAVNAGLERIEGEFHGIDASGALLLRDADGMMRRLTYGDVSLTGLTSNPHERTRL